jgi:hypothetical protein
MYTIYPFFCVINKKNYIPYSKAQVPAAAPFFFVLSIKKIKYIPYSKAQVPAAAAADAVLSAAV